MAHSIEILPDSDIDSVVRAHWDALEEAGLPSAGRIRQSTNRPHCTLVAGTSIDPDADDAIAAAAHRTPFRMALGAPLAFPARSRFVLVRTIVPSFDLLSVHADVVATTQKWVTDVAAHCRPGEWTPHITLARRLTATELTAALELLDFSTVVGAASALRRWDGDAASDVVFPGTPHAGNERN